MRTLNLATRTNERALRVLRSLRARHEKQAQQIDILCTDMVSAHEDFSLRLGRLRFAAGFYQSLLSARDRESVLDTAVQCLCAHIEQASAAVFLLSESGFDIHLADAGLAQQVHVFSARRAPRVSN